MAKDLSDLITDLLRIAYIFIMVYVAYQVLRAVLGGTWATENIIIAGVGIVMAGMFVIVGFLISQARMIGKLEERINGVVQKSDYQERPKLVYEK